ncbi:hypothetical protein JJQ94_24015 [Pseudoalteromonas sp. GCY]|uniref:hypothetical protein n=1 Tax=Pseudoalteromonas sp. GCY TaxID=2003316 RepID=UPI00155747E5|nr:hypothetical protein [Pseudoalteromonas sp. GCY]QQQ67256.1 hypothetical protein JJQ94_24015 [Pseudoalteromonas sp. GCY]
MKKAESRTFHVLSNYEVKKISGGDCYYADEKYAEGEKIKHPDGSTQTCSGGSWV